MPETKTITINDIRKIIDETNMTKPETTVLWNGFEIKVKQLLSLEEVSLVVNSIVKTCFSDNGYIPANKDYATRYIIITMCTNIDLGEDYNEISDILYGTDLFNIVKSILNEEQWNGICEAVDKGIEYLSNSNNAVVNQKTIELFNKLGEIEEGLGKVFSGVDKSDVEKIAGAISGGKIDEEALVKNYIKATK